MTFKDATKFIILRSLGNFLVLMALFGVFATFGPAIYYEISFRTVNLFGIQYEVSEVKDETKPVVKSDSPGFGDLLNSKKEQTIVPPDTDFSILIPKIGATSKVFPNIDPSNEASFVPILQEGVAHAEGTVFPGMEGNIYLFAHSTDN